MLNHPPEQSEEIDIITRQYQLRFFKQHKSLIYISVVDICFPSK